LTSESEHLRQRVAELERVLDERNTEMLLSYEAMVVGWMRALELRDVETSDHSHRVTDLTLQLARTLHVSEQHLEHIRRGALLHDVGKIAIPDAILHKPGPLTPMEYAVMQLHTSYAATMLSSIPFLQAAIDIPYCHHEKWDGSGYPRGLKEDEIPFAARLFAVVDVYDALRSERPYRPAWPEAQVWCYLQEQAGHHFDPYITDVFLQHIAW
jgi:putative nucleotidyltransferase with HDIG domain